MLLAYYDPDNRLIYAGRAGTGIDHAELERLWRSLQPLATSKMPLDMPPPRDSRFGSPLTLSRVHWVRPELVAEVEYLTWTEDNLLRQVVYEGLREDKPAADVRRAVPYPKLPEPKHRLPEQSGPDPADRQRSPLACRTYFSDRARARPGKPDAVRPRFNLSVGHRLLAPPAAVHASRGRRSSPLSLLISSRFEPPPAGLSLTTMTPGDRRKGPDRRGLATNRRNR